jgi:peptidoglycan hydrolase CwlO-like protein
MIITSSAKNMKNKLYIILIGTAVVTLSVLVYPHLDLTTESTYVRTETTPKAQYSDDLKEIMSRAEFKEQQRLQAQLINYRETKEEKQAHINALQAEMKTLDAKIEETRANLVDF